MLSRNDNICNVKKVKNVWYEESCYFCPNTIFENEFYYHIHREFTTIKCCKQCIEKVYKRLYEE